MRKAKGRTAGATNANVNENNANVSNTASATSAIRTSIGEINQ